MLTLFYDFDMMDVTSATYYRPIISKHKHLSYQTIKFENTPEEATAQWGNGHTVYKPCQVLCNEKIGLQKLSN